MEGWETVEWNILRQRGKHTFQGCEWKGTEITLPKTNPIIYCEQLPLILHSQTPSK